MEIKEKLNKPYTEQQRLDFIVQYNHNLQYVIKETDTALVAYGKTEEEQNAVGYSYDPDTLLFITIEKLYIDEMASIREGKTIYIMPANCTTTDPTSGLSEHRVAKYDKETDGWDFIDDYRGCWIVDNNMIPEKVEQIGSIKDGFIVITEEQKDEITNDKDLYIIKNDKLVKNPNYDEAKTNERKANFQ